MNRFELNNKQFHSYLNNTEIRRDIEDDVFSGKSEKKEILRLALNLYTSNSENNLKLTWPFKLLRFLKHFKLSNNSYTSNGGKINDSIFFVKQIQYHLNGLVNTSILSSRELRELLQQSLRIYREYYNNGIYTILHKELSNCQNLQEFYSGETYIDLTFAKNLNNLRIVDLWVNDANNKQGYYRKGGERHVIGLNYLNHCIVLHLMDSLVAEFDKIPSSIISLSVRNSNFHDISSILNKTELEYLDISYNEIKPFENDFNKFEKLKVLNLCSLRFQQENDKISFFKKLNSLENIEIIIDKATYNWLEENAIVNSILLNSFIVDSETYNEGLLRSDDILEILNIVERYKHDWKINPPKGADFKKVIERKLKI